MLLKRRSLWDVWDSLYKVFSIMFMIQITSPNMKCEYSKDVVKQRRKKPYIQDFRLMVNTKCLLSCFLCLETKLKNYGLFVLIINRLLLETLANKDSTSMSGSEAEDVILLCDWGARDHMSLSQWLLGEYPGIYLVITRLLYGSGHQSWLVQANLAPLFPVLPPRLQSFYF